jgi:hypothetical protein
MKIYVPNATAPKGLDKVIVPLGQDAWHGFAEEAMWAKKVGDELYELHNTPFFAKGLAFLDVVTVRQKDGRLVVINTSTPSRRSTYRALVQQDAPQPQVGQALAKLAALGCTYESYEDVKWTLYAFDIPASAVDAAYKTLDAAEKQGLLDFEEGHFGGREH